MILIGSLILTVLGTLLIFIFEFTNSQTIGQFTTFEKIINSLFTSMSTRTAGFNSFDMSLTHDYTNIICAILMFIGGGPASTAGGIKITTFILSLLMIFSHLKGKENITFSGREIPYNLGVRSLIILVLSIFIVLIMIIIILILEDQYNFSLLTFEIFSAFATNGMSTGASSLLNDYSKIVFILGMFVGRLGPMTLALLISGSKKQTEFRFFQEKVRIG
jgi:trk system potassium uptake protein TrkH